MIAELGTIYQEDRDILITFPCRNEAYLVDEAAFQRFLTRFAKGCKLSELEDMIPPEEAEGLK